MYLSHINPHTHTHLRPFMFKNGKKEKGNSTFQIWNSLEAKQQNQPTVTEQKGRLKAPNNCSRYSADYRLSIQSWAGTVSGNKQYYQAKHRRGEGKPSHLHAKAKPVELVLVLDHNRLTMGATADAPVSNRGCKLHLFLKWRTFIGQWWNASVLYNSPIAAFLSGDWVSVHCSHVSSRHINTSFRQAFQCITTLI